MRILVTGGSGFLGSHLARALADKGHEVRVFGRRPCTLQNIKSFTGDITDEAALAPAIEGCQAVFHTASKVGMGADKDEFFRVNVLGTRALVKRCRAARVQAIVHTSTPSVVFKMGGFLNADESVPYSSKFYNAYAATKAQAEKEILAQADEALKICALRPHLIFGKGDPHLLPQVVALARAGKLRIIGNGETLVDITHIDNAVAAHLLALDALLNGRANAKAYFISQGKPVKLWPWLNHALEKVGIPPVTKRVPYPLAYTLGALCEPLFKNKKAPPMTRFTAANLAHNHTFNISAARHDLAYTPLDNTEQGLNEWAESFLRKEEEEREKRK